MNIITKMEITKRDKERVNIYINEEFAFAASAEIIYKQNLKVKDSIDLEKIKKIVEEDNYIKCKNKAFKIVERTHITEKNLKDKLLLKGFDIATVDKTIKMLNEYNFINDANYTKMYINDKVKVQGTKKIKYSLLQKGIDEAIIENELSNISQDNIKDTAYKLAEKKYNLLIKRECDKYKLSQKLFRFLVSKGYDFEICSNVIKEVMDREKHY